ncbi:dihydroorotate dehydrogenase electron transfer subunit [Thermosulfurimonas marina]|uniref:dihydroorotate dehydrogenase electron transfer subunit n=1 Tax=Thermosulfurimonas marina TaxID=2047767 RepID=UPI00144AE2FC|nr:dihydroorotate dehydrogenase electron transfer subunit [Thermosulfurimonas marina]
MRPAKVRSRRRLAPGYFLLEIEAPEAAPRARPGQFVRLKAWPGYDPLLPRPFSIHARSEKTLSFLIQERGRATAVLSRLRPGEEVWWDGPLGHPFPLPERGEVWLVAGGVGLAPFFFYLETLRARGLSARLFYGARTRGDLVRLSALERLCPVQVATEDGSRGRPGLVTDLLREALKKGSPEFILACGPPGMLAAVGHLGERAGVPVYLSLEAMMACGRGLCLGCAVSRKGGGYLKVCVEGPVFPAEEVDLDRLG